MLKSYLAMSRPDHWIKNLLILPGVLFAYFLAGAGSFHAVDFFLLFVSVCFVTAANYVLNEWADAAFDQHHPVKQLRPAVQEPLTTTGVFITYYCFLVLGLIGAYRISVPMFVLCAFLAAQGFFYNVRPFRLKDRVYLDVVFESINNPLRFLVGWLFISPSSAPAISLMLSYWCAGAFFMNVKRLAEYRFFQDKTRAGQYRHSFQVYNEKNLSQLSVLYAICSFLLWGIFCLEVGHTLIVTLPAAGIFFAWYGFIGMKKDSVAQHPEQLFLEPLFFLYALLICFGVGYLLWHGGLQGIRLH